MRVTFDLVLEVSYQFWFYSEPSNITVDENTNNKNKTNDRIE